jgi:hypothetical protein
MLKPLTCALALAALSTGWTSSARADRFDDMVESAARLCDAYKHREIGCHYAFPRFDL